MKKGEKGVTVLSVAISVLVIIIITNVLAFSAKDSVYIKSLTNLNNDIELLREKISAHYSQYGEIPAKISYTIPSDWGGNEFIGANDVDENNIEGNGFYVIDLQAIDGLTLNYGEGYEEIDKTAESISGKVDDDLYIINKNSHNIFYVKGVNVPANGTTKSYYTDEKNVDTIKVALQEIGEQDEKPPDDNVNPSVAISYEIIYPLNGIDLIIYVTMSDDKSGIDLSKCSWTLTYLGGSSVADQKGTFTMDDDVVDIRNVQKGNYKFTVICTDLAGNQIESSRDITVKFYNLSL